MDKILGLLLISLLGIVFAVSLSYYTINQPNQTSNNPSPTPTPATTPTPTNTHDSTPVPTAEPTPAYDYVVYEWHLKAEYINNVTWLNWSMAAVTVGDKIRSTSYNSSKTWSENYIAYVNHFEDIPQQVADSESMGPISKWSFIRQLSVNSSFNEATGYTKAFCQYAEYHDVPFQYGIELELPLLADDKGWTKTFV